MGYALNYSKISPRKKQIIPYLKAQVLSKSSAKGQTVSKENYGVLNSSKKRMKITILNIFFIQDSEFRSFFGRIEETIYCFRDVLTFSLKVGLNH